MNTDELVLTGLPMRTVAALERAGITTLAHLAPLTRRELREIKGVGKKGAYEASRIVGCAVDVAVAESRCSAGHAVG